MLRLVCGGALFSTTQFPVKRLRNVVVFLKNLNHPKRVVAYATTSVWGAFSSTTQFQVKRLRNEALFYDLPPNLSWQKQPQP